MPRVLHTVVKIYYKARLYSSGTYAGVPTCKRLRRTHMPHIVCQCGRTHLWIHHLFCKIQNATMSTRDQQTLVDQSWETPPKYWQHTTRLVPQLPCRHLWAPSTWYLIIVPLKNSAMWRNSSIHWEYIFSNWSWYQCSYITDITSDLLEPKWTSGLCQAFCS